MAGLSAGGAKRKLRQLRQQLATDQMALLKIRRLLEPYYELGASRDDLVSAVEDLISLQESGETQTIPAQPAATPFPALTMTPAAIPQADAPVFVIPNLSAPVPAISAVPAPPAASEAKPHLSPEEMVSAFDAKLKARLAKESVEGVRRRAPGSSGLPSKGQKVDPTQAYSLIEKITGKKAAPAPMSGRPIER